MSPRPVGGSPAISVVVPTRDRAARLERLLDSLREQSLDADEFEVIVVDDGSRDATSAVLAAAGSAGDLSLRVVARTGSGGPAAARNEGWREARAEVVAFTDDDCEATPGWLQALLDAARERPGAIVAGPTTPLPTEAERIGPLARTRDLPAADEWFASCNIAYPRDLLVRLEGFDERFGEALGEDTDLGWRARELGAELHFEPRAAVHHAVDEVGVAGALREALVGVDSVYAFRRHPELRRRTLWLGVVRNRALPRLLLAALGLRYARHRPWAATLAVPYALSVARRCAGPGAGPSFAAFFVAHDALSLATSLRGSIRHRTLVL